MSAIAIAIGGGALISAVVASNSASDATSVQRDAANQATAVSQGQYGQTREDLAPYRQAGAQALGQITSQLPDLTRSFSLADFQNDPGYQFRMDEGQKALERSAAARGGLNSGATLKALTRYGQGVASDEYNTAYNRFNTDRSNRFNRLASVAGIGQTGTNTTVAAAQNNASNIAGNINAAGNASAANSIAQGNNINSAIGNGMNTWLNSQYMNRNTQSYSNPSSNWNPNSMTMPQMGSSYGSY